MSLLLFLLPFLLVGIGGVETGEPLIENEVTVTGSYSTTVTSNVANPWVSILVTFAATPVPGPTKEIHGFINPELHHIRFVHHGFTLTEE